MSQNFLQPGEHITIAAAPVAVSSGDGVLVGSMFGVASGDAASGEEVVLAVVGVFEFSKVVGEAFTVGQPLYFTTATQALTSTATGNVLIGVAIKAAASADITAEVRLHGAWGK